MNPYEYCLDFLFYEGRKQLPPRPAGLLLHEWYACLFKREVRKTAKLRLERLNYM